MHINIIIKDIKIIYLGYRIKSLTKKIDQYY